MARSAQTLPQLTARAELVLGFAGEVGDPMKLVVAKQGLRPAKNLDAALAHELADCLLSVLLIADSYDVALEPAFLATMRLLGQKLTPPRRTKTARKSRAHQVALGPRSRSDPRSGS